VAIIELDDGLYLQALSYLGGRSSGGVIEGFPDFLVPPASRTSPVPRRIVDSIS
jgi:hypothetical protein